MHRDEKIEKMARAMCERDGFDWDAASAHHTANGEEPEQQREYWRDKADAALAAALEVDQPVAVEEWQPIETAPKSNGSETFLAFIQGHGMCVCACTVLGNVYSVARNRTITKATHWRPLPTPPSSPRISASSAEAGGSAILSKGGQNDG